MTLKAQKNQHIRALLVMCFGKSFAIIDAEFDVWVGRTAAYFAAFDTSCGSKCDLDNTNSSIQRSAREHLFKIEGEYVRFIHHWSEDAVNHISNEWRQARDLGEESHSVTRT